MGGPEGHPGRPQAQQPRGPDRGPPARVPRLPRRDPGGQLRRRDDEDLRPRHLRGPQVARQGGDGHVPRRARARQVRAVPDGREELDDPPHGPAGGPDAGAAARADRADARPPGELPPDDGWAFEIKWDGVRAVALRRGRAAAELESRNTDEHHAALPGAARAGPRARHARGGARRRGRLLRGRRAELPAPAAAHAPDLGGAGAPALADRARRLHDLRPALARRPLAARAALRGPPHAAGQARARRPGLAGAGAPRRRRRGDARGLAARRGWRGSSPSGSTARTSRAGARTAG